MLSCLICSIRYIKCVRAKAESVGGLHTWNISLILQLEIMPISNIIGGDDASEGFAICINKSSGGFSV